jgi:hypothetical protein
MTECLGKATASSETRLTITINGTRELMQDLENLNHRLTAIKGRLLGQFDDPSPPINKEVEPDRPVVDQLDYMLSRISDKISEAKQHTAALEEL